MKARLVLFSPKAERQLQSLFRYISKSSSPRIAASYVNSIREHCDGLGLSPHRGEDMGDRKPGLRTVGFDRSATIAFRILPEVVLIAGIFYRGRNVRAHL